MTHEQEWNNAVERAFKHEKDRDGHQTVAISNTALLYMNSFLNNLRADVKRVIEERDTVYADLQRISAELHAEIDTLVNERNNYHKDRMERDGEYKKMVGDLSASIVAERKAIADGIRRLVRISDAPHLANCVERGEFGKGE